METGQSKSDAVYEVVSHITASERVKKEASCVQTAVLCHFCTRFYDSKLKRVYQVEA